MDRKCEAQSSWGAKQTGESLWGQGERKSEAAAATLITRGQTLSSRDCSPGARHWPFPGSFRGEQGGPGAGVWAWRGRRERVCESHVCPSGRGSWVGRQELWALLCTC